MKVNSRFKKLFNTEPFILNKLGPANKSWVICAMVSKKVNDIKIRTAYYENGVFWENSGSKAVNIDTDSWEIEEWIPLEN